MVNKTEYNLENQFSLITGAAGLLGEQHAIALLDISSNIILTDINAKKLNKLKKKLQTIYPYLKILSFVMDVTSEKSIRKVSRRLIKNKINLKVLINNAAIDAKFDNKSKAIKKGSIENLNLKVLKKEIDVGLIGYILVTKIFIDLLKKNKKGSIILNIASDLSSIAPNHNIYPKNNYKPISYSVIKHGVVGITKYLATYLNRYNIRCNTLSPGSVKNMQPKTFINKIKKLIPLNRLARHNEYHGAIKFLCTDASSYMNGQNIIIDGGRSIW